MRIKAKFLRKSLAVLPGLLLSTLPAHAALVSENFDSVTGVSSTTPRTVSDINATSPGQIATGSVWASIPNNNASDVNVRSAGDAINTTAAPNGFGNFFGPATSTNQFLVLGDQSGAIGGNPTGGLLGELFGYAVPFSVQTGGASVTVDFDWAFNGVDTSTALLQHDTFLSGVIGGSINWSSMLTGSLTSTPSVTATLLQAQASPAGFQNGHVSQTLNNLGPGSYFLVFALAEAAGTATNTAVGIDNITVATVPVPAALWLLITGLLGTGMTVSPRKMAVSA